MCTSQGRLLNEGRAELNFRSGQPRDLGRVQESAGKQGMFTPLCLPNQKKSLHPFSPTYPYDALTNNENG
jgi:hypothetical protein